MLSSLVYKVSAHSINLLSYLFRQLIYYHSVNFFPDINAGPSEVKAFAMCTQRGTFVTWDKQTGKPFHNLITWKDLRADHLVKAWNNSWTMAAIRAGSSLLHMLTRNKRYLAGTVFKFLNGLVCMRLRWMLDNDEVLRKAAEQGSAAMGTIDSFLINRYHNHETCLPQCSYLTILFLFIKTPHFTFF